MRWTPGGRSEDVEDARGQSSGTRFRSPRLGLGGLLVLFVLSVIFHKDFFALLGVSGNAGGTASVPASAPGPRATSPEEEKLVQFVSFVLDDVQNTWASAFAASGGEYERAKLRLFTDATSSGCGYAEAAMGPFYCPSDHKVYVDLGFYSELKERFGAPGDFAQAYVLAHEVGHHVQAQLGIDEQMRALQARNPARANELSVRLELQADCFAGVWGNSAARRQILEEGDVEEGLGAAAAVGDDRIQRSSGQGVRPESWTHGSSAQRVSWFRRGLSSGRMDQCDTFADLVKSRTR